MKYVGLLILLLSGCTLQLTHSTRLYALCYKDDKVMTITGQWQSNELYYKCDKRRELGVETKFGAEHNNDIVTDFKSKD